MQIVQGNGFQFDAPAGWTVTHSGQTVSASDGVDLTRVSTFMLLKPYRHALLAGATRELDGDVSKLAAALKGKVTARATTEVAGHDARMSTIKYGGQAQQITFVLDGSREYELLCRIEAKSSPVPCQRLVSTFELSS